MVYASSLVSGGEEIPITVVVSTKRTTIGITVKESGEVIVRLPKTVTREEGIAFAQRKIDWIVKHRATFSAREKPVRWYLDGDTIPFCGRTLTIQRVTGDTVRAELIENTLRITAPEDVDRDAIADSVIFLYRRAGLALLREMVTEISAAAGVDAPPVRIRRQEKKWGCCTPKTGSS